MSSVTPRNLLIIKTDEQRFDTIAALGHSVVKTPNLDRLHAQSVCFDNAFTVSPLCVPSRTSFFTGNYPHVNKAAYNHPWDHLSLDQCGLLRRLKDAGCRIGLAGKNHTFQEEVFEALFDYRQQTGHWGKEVGTITDADRAVADYLHADPRPEYAGSFAMLEGLIDRPMPFDETVCPAHRIGDDAITFLRDAGR
ncbi:MAG: sulfatase-like hydrolase/transferase, partial [Planctomycetota bacterium]